MITHSPTIAVTLAVDMTALLLYNVAGMAVTGHLGAVFRTVLETGRTLFVWIVDLALFYGVSSPGEGRARLGESWSSWSWMQLGGFAVLVAGTLVYGRGDDAEAVAAAAEAGEAAAAEAGEEQVIAAAAPPLPSASDQLLPPAPSAAGPSLALAVARHGGLRRLVLADNGLLDSGVAQVCAALARGAAPGLEELDLSLNEVTPVGARSIATALKSLKKLKILSVRENELENAGARALAAGVAACPSLTRLDATQNQLRRPGAVALARAASRAPGLELLALDDNEVSDEGVEEVEEILRGAGKAGALGPMDDNDGDGDDDNDEEEEEEEEEGGEEEGAGEEGGDGIDLDLSKALDAALKI